MTERADDVAPQQAPASELAGRAGKAQSEQIYPAESGHDEANAIERGPPGVAIEPRQGSSAGPESAVEGADETDRSAKSSVINLPASFLGTEHQVTAHARARAAPIAMIFNAHGVLSTLDSPDVTHRPGDDAADAMQRPSMPEQSRAPVAALLRQFHELLLAGSLDEAIAAFRSAITLISASATAAPQSRAGEHPRAVGHQAKDAPNQAVPEPSEQEAQVEASEREVEQPRRAGASRRLPDESSPDSSSTIAQLMVEAVEHGLRLVARAERLTREQRLRLRTEIVHLLASHGLSAEEVRLNGEPIPARHL